VTDGPGAEGAGAGAGAGARRARRARRRRRLTLLVTLLAIGAAGLAWFRWFPAWWLNADGAGYLAISRNLVHGDGLRLPDGRALAWWNRPVYPAWLALGWLVREDPGASIWMSRLALVAAGPLVAAAVWRWTARTWPAVVAGVAAVAQPMTLLAGGANFVPDGLTATALAAAAISATLAAATPRLRRGWLAAAGVATVVAAGTKETGLLALPLVAVLTWAGRTRPPRTRTLAALGLLATGTYGALLALAGPLVVPAGEVPGLLRRALRFQITGEPLLVWTGLALLVLLVTYAAVTVDRPLSRTGLALVAVGVPQAVYATGAGLGLRNAATVPLGAALVVGSLAGSVPTRARARLRVGAALASVTVVAWGTLASVTHPSRAGDPSVRSWDNPATRAVTAWLERAADGAPVGCTFIFCSALWLQADGRLDLHLLPQAAARAGPRSLSDVHFTLRSGWRGPEPGRPACRGPMLVLVRSDERFGSIFECALLRAVRYQRLRYLVVTEGPSGNTFDAARLIPYLERHPSFRRVYESLPGDWPRVIAVYEVVAPPTPLPRPRLVLSPPARYALRRSPLPRPHVTFDATCLYDVVRRAFSQPDDPRRARPSERAWEAAPIAGCTRR